MGHRVKGNLSLSDYEPYERSVAIEKIIKELVRMWSLVIYSNEVISFAKRESLSVCGHSPYTPNEVPSRPTRGACPYMMIHEII